MRIYLLLYCHMTGLVGCACYNLIGIYVIEILIIQQVHV